MLAERVAGACRMEGELVGSGLDPGARDRGLERRAHPAEHRRYGLRQRQLDRRRRFDLGAGCRAHHRLEPYPRREPADSLRRGEPLPGACGRRDGQDAVAVRACCLEARRKLRARLSEVDRLGLVPRKLQPDVARRLREVDLDRSARSEMKERRPHAGGRRDEARLDVLGAAHEPADERGALDRRPDDDPLAGRQLADRPDPPVANPNRDTAPVDGRRDSRERFARRSELDRGERLWVVPDRRGRPPDVERDEPGGDGNREQDRQNDRQLRALLLAPARRCGGYWLYELVDISPLYPKGARSNRRTRHPPGSRLHSAR